LWQIFPCFVEQVNLLYMSSMGLRGLTLATLLQNYTYAIATISLRGTQYNSFYSDNAVCLQTLADCPHSHRNGFNVLVLQTYKL